MEDFGRRLTGFLKGDSMRRSKRRTPRIGTVIGQDTQVSGNLNFAGGLHLDGRIVGNVSGQGDGQSTLVVSEHGVIEGDVRVDNLILGGTVRGDVYAREHAELATDAKVTGTVYYKLLEMAMGAEVNGQLVHEDERSLDAAATPATSAVGEEIPPDRNT
jgi:cytoskeletal protein CcmA (bactofilin family)